MQHAPVLRLFFIACLAFGGTAQAQLLIGQTAGFTGPVASGVKETTEGAKLYIDSVNAKGGVNGQKIELVSLDDKFDPDKLSDTQIDQINATSLETGARIISIECMWGLNHIDPDAAKREQIHERFIRCLEFGHRLGCKFVGTFSGGIPKATPETQAKALAEVVNEKYMPVLERFPE